MLARAAASALARRAVESATQTSSRSKRGSSNYVTTQHDTVRQYRFKRMPKAQRKKWVKKVKANAAMDFALAGTRTSVYNGSLEKSIRTGQTQGAMSVHLYGNNGAEETIDGAIWEYGHADVNYLISRDAQLTSAGQQLPKFRFTSAVIDITARNSSTNNLALEVDLYVVKYTSETDAKSFWSLHNQSVNKLNNSNTGSAGPLSLEKRGVTPFDIPSLASYGVKILSKQKFFLPNGNTFTYQYRDPRNHHYHVGQQSDNDGFILPHQTISLLAVFKPIVGGSTADAKLTIGCTRTYRYGIIGQNQLAGDFYTP